MYRQINLKRTHLNGFLFEGRSCDMSFLTNRGWEFHISQYFGHRVVFKTFQRFVMWHVVSDKLRVGILYQSKFYSSCFFSISSKVCHVSCRFWETKGVDFILVFNCYLFLTPHLFSFSGFLPRVLYVCVDFPSQ